MTAPTGDGKTEAALHAASVLGRVSGVGGVFVALPTMATADAMLSRVEEFARVNVGGDRALVLLHSMAWLSRHGGSDEGDRGAVVADGVTSLEAGRWLSGGRRGLLAPLGVGTVDQVLTGVLPVRFNVLRLLGLANKVLVVDEAHAYGPWMHTLLVRLLEWLGALRVPVVLLSATLSGRVASSLVEAYRRGCGFREPVGVESCYPGWLFVDAASGEVSRPRAVGSDRPRTLRVVVEPVSWDVREPAGARVVVGSRRAALVEYLTPVVERGGCVLVCCTTVDEAQRTFRFLRSAFPDLAGEEGGLRLLHARFPAWRREEITGECERAFGKPGGVGVGRPVRSVLVATQVVEQSLDLDFDLVVSDLAPLAQLLQRAGRCLRHERGGRPGWVGADPRLVVLDPLGEGGMEPPRSWGEVYDASLLIRTRQLLVERAGEGIAVPGDVQQVVDEVYAEDFGERLDQAAREELIRRDVRRVAGEAAEKQLANLTAVPSPYASSLRDLSLLSGTGELVDEALVTTRLGADSERAVCVYEQPDGLLTLDPEGVRRLPGADRRRLSVEQVAEVMRHTVAAARAVAGGAG
ncbi:MULTISPECIES: helicase-related protein [unclassified Streptomyces]|uniref:helicase-related protein n=1 Tax=unclassified Streptomyces TaxID=2593676 RepID=UPI003369C36E